MKLAPPAKHKPVAGDYSNILRSHGVNFKEVDEHYYQVGSSRKTAGWLLHVSCVKRQIPDLYKLVVPELIKKKVSFKLIKNATSAETNLSGGLGYESLGKILVISPVSDVDAREIAMKLIALCSQFTGPAIHTDSWLGGNVYTQFNEPSHSSPLPNDDVEEILFKLPEGVAWPFGEIASPTPFSNSKTLRNRYFIRREIRAKPKGRVLDALQIKGIFIKKCIVKEIRRGMQDEMGRDLSERLDWQNTLHSILSKEIRLPRIFDIFRDNGNSYLVMERIKGQTLQSSVNEIYNETFWPTLPVKAKKIILGYLIELISIVGRIHLCGIVHRDLTPENIVITKENDLFVIDLELAYDTRNNKPTPPYRLGTFGYMSPEQLNGETPTASEDIYAIGATMIFMFSNMSPTKFNLANSLDLKERLNFFLGDQEITQIITECLKENAELRIKLPDLDKKVQRLFSKYQEVRPVQTPLNASADSEELRRLTTSVLNSFALETMKSAAGLWHTNQTNLHQIGNKRMGTLISPGYYSGISGILMTISHAKKVGFDISESLRSTYERNYKHLVYYCESRPMDLCPGLYFGSTGAVMGITCAIESGLVKGDKNVIQLLGRLVTLSPSSLAVSNGAAGHGLCILRSLSMIGRAKADVILQQHIDHILSVQGSDGSWSIDGEKKTGLSDGIAGIVLFLAKYVSEFPNNRVLSSISNALTYLQRKAKLSHGKIYWHQSDKNKTAEMGFNNGFCGIALAFLHGFEVLGNSEFMRIAEKALRNVPFKLVDSEFSLSTGFSGLGEVYLEAYRINKEEEWRERSDWLVNLLRHAMFCIDRENCYWVMNSNQHPSGDLFTGSGGPLHFLLKHQNVNHKYISLLT